MAWIENIFLGFYPWSLAFHLISIISWMAGLLYLPRIFVYHVENRDEGESFSGVFQVMEKKLYLFIMRPAMISSWFFGLVLIFTPGIIDWNTGWPWVKAAMVLGLTWYHVLLGRWRKELVSEIKVHDGRFFRMVNEIPAILMIVIVLMVVGRPF